MNEIKVLDAAVFNRIAAGEVVDRPASVVKELIENAVDAGAKNIAVDIAGGGISLIKVSDDGSGIKPEFVSTAFKPHATSKIGRVEDLDAIGTLGFRGEALPSIASVAKVTMLTRADGMDMGTRYVIDNGREVDFGEMGAPKGTSVTVEDLFGRIPARKKFLSGDRAEESAVTGVVAKQILANPTVAFSYTVNGKIVYDSGGGGVKDAIKTVYGDDYLKNMIELHSTMSDIKLCGYINKPSFSKHSKAFQTLVVNGRYVVSEDISYTVFGCYQKYLMKRQYPTYMLYLDIPCDLVDVNVHPNKLEVKFAAPALIKKIVADAVKEQVLDAVSVPKELSGVFAPREREAPDFFEVDGTVSLRTFAPRGNPARTASAESGPAADFFEPPAERTAFVPPAEKPDVRVFEPKAPTQRADSSLLGDVPSPASVMREPHRRFKMKEGDEFSAFVPPSQTTAASLADIPPLPRVAGKLFNTYILVEEGEYVCVIDQHAAHEKLLYDRLEAETAKGSVAVQRMLVPYEFRVTSDEARLLCENAALLTRSGFELAQDPMDAMKFSLRSVPLCCVGMSVESFVSDFIGEVPFSGDSFPRSAKEVLMQTACKAAAKGEDDLSESEIDALLTQMRNETKELFCPHGRPTAIRIGRREIEKWFKRIV